MRIRRVSIPESRGFGAARRFRKSFRRSGAGIQGEDR
jgi:hypothetical protein